MAPPVETSDAIVAAQLSAVCATILRARIPNFEQLPDDQQLTFIKDEAGHIAEIATVLCQHLDASGRWMSGAPDGFPRWLLLALMQLSLEMKGLAQW